jgi:hypothetical protein
MVLASNDKSTSLVLLGIVFSLNKAVRIFAWFGNYCLLNSHCSISSTPDNASAGKRDLNYLCEKGIK